MPWFITLASSGCKLDFEPLKHEEDSWVTLASSLLERFPLERERESSTKETFTRKASTRSCPRRLRGWVANKTLHNKVLENVRICNEFWLNNFKQFELGCFFESAHIVRKRWNLKRDSGGLSVNWDQATRIRVAVWYAVYLSSPKLKLLARNAPKRSANSFRCHAFLG